MQPTVESPMALFMTALFLIVAVAAKIIMHYRLTGDHGVRSSLKHSSKVAKVAGILLLGSFLGVIVLSVLSFFDILTPDHSFGHWGDIIGILLCGCGIIIVSISQYQMGKHWRMGVDEAEVTELVSEGIYAMIRHPIYLGLMVFGIGLFVLLPTFSMFIVLVIGYISIELQVRAVEEPHMKNLHGEKYLEYTLRTRRYIP